MALDNKYRVHQGRRKDFRVSTKEITEILTKYRSAPKNHMQVLERYRPVRSLSSISPSIIK